MQCSVMADDTQDTLILSVTKAIVYSANRTLKLMPTKKLHHFYYFQLLEYICITCSVIWLILHAQSLVLSTLFRSL